MRESNFSSPSHNKASVCISSALYDRRAIDAPSPSLPLVNSLTHLSYLTATSPRIREILSLDGGLERLVRILKGCATGGPPIVETSLAELRGNNTPVKGPRRSPFKSFGEYASTIEIDDSTLDSLATTLASSSLRQEGEALLPWEVDDTVSAMDSASPIPPTPTRAKYLLYTYTLAFQCVVNIGVRGSETIRTRVVEAGALDVVVNVLQRYLEDVTRRKEQAELTAELSAAAAMSATPIAIPISLTAPASVPVTDIVFSPTPSRSRDFAPFDSAPPSYQLSIPARVSTPDTMVGLEEGSVADDNGSSSGQEGDEVMTDNEPRSQASTSSQTSSSSSTNLLEKAILTSSSRRQPLDTDGDIVMGPASSAHDDRTDNPTLESTSRQGANINNAQISSFANPSTSNGNNAGLHYRDEDVLLSLQLLAYLSKYPHVRSVFHSPHDSIIQPEYHDEDDVDDKRRQAYSAHDHSYHSQHSRDSTKSSSASTSASSTSPSSSSSNVFSLVEAFTHRPASTDLYTPRHSNEVQYWAGVIMRNACRKDESRGGIRQCANMQCGMWEKYAREFAKCRRCRKAKYCSKTCQSKAWQYGHRYWCAKAAPKDANTAAHDDTAASSPTAQGHHSHHHHSHHRHTHHSAADSPTPSGHEHGPGSRRHERRGARRDLDDDEDEVADYEEDAHHRHHHHHHTSTTLGGLDLAAAAAAHAIGAGLGVRTMLNRNRGITPRGHRSSPGTDSGVTTPPTQHRTGNEAGAGGFEVNVAGMGVRVGATTVGLDENDIAHDLLGGGLFGEIGTMTGLALGDN